MSNTKNFTETNGVEPPYILVDTENGIDNTEKVDQEYGQVTKSKISEPKSEEETPSPIIDNMIMTDEARKQEDTRVAEWKKDVASRPNGQQGNESSDDFIPITPNDVELNQMSSTLMTTLNEKKTVVGYYKQIANNVLIGKKAIYFICRDLYDASENLFQQEYDNLVTSIVQSLDIGKSTLSRYKSIGKSDTCTKLFNRGLLPMSVDTQYAITLLTDEQQKSLLADDSNMFISATKNQMLEFAGVQSDDTSTDPDKWTKYVNANPHEFIKIAVSSTNADSNKMQMFKQELVTLIDDFNADELYDTRLCKSDKYKDIRSMIEMISNDVYINEVVEKNKKYMSENKTHVLGHEEWMKKFDELNPKVEEEISSPLTD